MLRAAYPIELDDFRLNPLLPQNTLAPVAWLLWWVML